MSPLPISVRNLVPLSGLDTNSNAVKTFFLPLYLKLYGIVLQF